MSDQTLRARSVSELVDAAFSLYRRDASKYIMVTAIASLPGLVANVLVQPRAGAAFQAFSGTWFLAVVVSMISYSLMAGVVIRMGSDVYLGGEADVASAVTRVLPKTLTLVATAIVKALVLSLFALMLFFPVIYAFARWFAPEAAVVLEDKDSLAAMGRVSTLSEGMKGHILKTFFLGYFIYLLLAMAIGVATAFMGQVGGLVMQSLFTVVAYPIIGLLTMLLYYDTRIRKEGFDVEHLSRTLGEPLGAPAR